MSASALNSWLSFFTDDPGLRAMQGVVVLIGIILIFLVFFTTRDMLLRTHSLIYQLGCIVLVALLPVAGFLLYLMIRPARTIKEREMYDMLVDMTGKKKKGAGKDAST